MSTLKTLRGEPMFTLPMLGRTLTLYREGARLALFLAPATFVLFNLPWHLIPVAGDVFQALVAAIGSYLCAALLGSLTADGVDADAASSRWL